MMGMQCKGSQIYTSQPAIHASHSNIVGKRSVIGKIYEFFVDNKCHFLLLAQIQLP
jgi:hypothetical protein